MAIITRRLAPGDHGLLSNVAPDVFDDPINMASAAAFLAAPNSVLVAALDDGTNDVDRILVVDRTARRADLARAVVSVRHTLFERRGALRAVVHRMEDYVSVRNQRPPEVSRVPLAL